MLQETASLADGGAWTFLYVLFEEELSFLVRLAGSSRALSGLERFSLARDPSVALDRGKAHVEGASGLSFGHTPLYGGDYLLAEVF